MSTVFLFILALLALTLCVYYVPALRKRVLFSLLAGRVSQRTLYLMVYDRNAGVIYEHCMEKPVKERWMLIIDHANLLPLPPLYRKVYDLLVRVTPRGQRSEAELHNITQWVLARLLSYNFGDGMPKIPPAALGQVRVRLWG